MAVYISALLLCAATALAVDDKTAVLQVSSIKPEVVAAAAAAAAAPAASPASPCVNEISSRKTLFRGLTSEYGLLKRANPQALAPLAKLGCLEDLPPDDFFGDYSRRDDGLPSTSAEGREELKSFGSNLVHAGRVLGLLSEVPVVKASFQRLENCLKAACDRDEKAAQFKLANEPKMKEVIQSAENSEAIQRELTAGFAGIHKLLEGLGAESTWPTNADAQGKSDDVENRQVCIGKMMLGQVRILEDDLEYSQIPEYGRALTLMRTAEGAIEELLPALATNEARSSESRTLVEFATEAADDRDLIDQLHRGESFEVKAVMDSAETWIRSLRWADAGSATAVKVFAQVDELKSVQKKLEQENDKFRKGFGEFCKSAQAAAAAAEE